METAEQDVTIPKPVASGSVDFPDASQSGAVAPPPLPTGYQRVGEAPQAPPLPKGYARAESTSTAPNASKVAAVPSVKAEKGAAIPSTPDKDFLTEADESGVLNPAQSLATKTARGIRGVYHGVMGDEETSASKGKTTTASPEAAQLGFTPEHMGYEAGKMVRGVGQFVGEGVKDIVSKTPVIVPDENKSIGDPTAHTMLAKYITAPSQTERDASQQEMQKYFESQGPEAAGHAISAFLHGTLGEYVPAIGPLAMAITDQAQKGDLGGALAQIASLYAFEKGTGKVKEGIKDRVETKVTELTKPAAVKQAEANVEATSKPREIAQTKYNNALAEHNKYAASHAQGIDSPKPVKSALEKAQAELDEATAHNELAKEHLAKTQASQPTIPQQVGGAIGRTIGKVAPKAEEVPAEEVEAAPILKKLGEPKTSAVPIRPINVKGPGEIQPETIQRAPETAPKISPLGRVMLPEGPEQGVMGAQPLLKGETGNIVRGEVPARFKPIELTPEAPTEEKQTGLPKITTPEAPKFEPGNVKALKAEQGKVVDKEETVEGRVGKLLQEALKAEKSAEVKPESKAEHRAEERRQEEAGPPEGVEERRQGERRVLKGINEKAFRESAFGGGDKRIDTDAYAAATVQARKELGPNATKEAVIARRNELVAPEAKGTTGDIGDQARKNNPEPTRAETKTALPKEEPVGYEAKKEEVIKSGEEGREPAKSAAEYHPAVEQKVTELSDENIKKLAQAHGLNPDEYDFKARDERRHRTERDQLAKDIVGQMGEDEKINIGRLAERADKEPGFESRDRSAKANAERAAKVFPRLRGPVDEFGNAAVAGGAPTETDTDHVKRAMEELGPKASISDIMGKAQGYKNPSRPLNIEKSASDFNKAEGRKALKAEKVEQSPRAKEIADEYTNMKHDPENTEVKKSYKALVDDTKRQWELAKQMGIKIEPTEEDPYKSYEELRDDVKNNKRLKVFTGGNPLPEDHPLAAVDPKTGQSYNTMFRAVHDLFGHLAQDNDFSEKGEENAWNTHRQMMTPEAVPAMTTETRGQTSWFFNHDGAKGEFADQKAGLLPDFANAPTPDSKTTLEHIKSGKDYAVLTAENPNNTRVTPEENAARNRELVADLRSKGYEPVPVEGNTKDVEGQKEHSYFVPDITPKEAAELGRKHGQAAVLTTEGLHDLKEDVVNPSDNNKVITGEEARKQPYYTKVGDTDFSVPIDFNKVAEPGKEPLPTVSGGAPEKKLPTGDELIKKYGESSGDPKDLTFILKDGRGVKNTGSIHDEMLGGKATDKNPPRERFVAEGNIRVRPHQGTAGREVSFSIPESGVSQAQLKYIQKMSPQLKSGAVQLEIGKPGGDYRTIPYGEATPEVIEKSIRDMASVLNPKGSPIDEFGNPTVSGGSPSAGTSKAKIEPTPEDLKYALPELAQKHLTEEEKTGLTTTATGKPRTAGTEKFVKTLEKIPEVQEYTDIALAGEGARHWYQRSTKAFDSLVEEAPDYFKEGDRDQFLNLLAASSPRQSVAMNLRETLRTWKAYVDAGRPTGDELKKVLTENLTPASSKVPNALKAMNKEEMWPDLTKNANFKVPSFAKNLRGWLGAVTNDGWMSLFAGLDPKEISKPESYHPMAVATRAAAEELGWEPAEAQAAIWSFTQALTERGEELPEEVRKHSEDFVDLLAHDPQVRDLLADLGVTHANLDAKLKAIGEKPEVSGRTTATTANSIRQLKERIEAARGTGAIPPPKSAQGGFEFREAPAHESRTRDEAVEFNPESFKTQTSGELEPYGKKNKKFPLGRIK